MRARVLMAEEELQRLAECTAEALSRRRMPTAAAAASQPRYFGSHAVLQSRTHGDVISPHNPRCNSSSRLSAKTRPKYGTFFQRRSVKSTFSYLSVYRYHTYIYIYTYIRLKKVDKRNLNRESYIGMHTVNYLGLVQVQIHIYSSGHGITKL